MEGGVGVGSGMSSAMQSFAPVVVCAESGRQSKGDELSAGVGLVADLDGRGDLAVEEAVEDVGGVGVKAPPAPGTSSADAPATSRWTRPVRRPRCSSA